MTIDFHHPDDRKTYAKREVDSKWKQFVSDHFTIEGAAAADIGCGGGRFAPSNRTLDFA